MTAGMTDPERSASQRELDILRQRVDGIDANGTRGVGSVQIQVGELVKDLADLRADNRAWQGQHERQHERDAQNRVTARRWLIGVGIAGIASMATMITLLLDIASHVHG